MTNLRALPDPAAEPTLSVERAAAVLGIGRTTMHDHLRRGDLPTIRIGARILIPTAKFLAHYGLTPDQKPSLAASGATAPTADRDA